MRTSLIEDCVACGRPRCVQRAKCHHCGHEHAKPKLALVLEPRRQAEKLRIAPPVQKMRHSAFVYLITDGTFCKIGFTKDLQQRLQTLQSATPHDLQLVDAVETEQAQALEGFLHGLFAAKHHRNEWFTSISLEDWRVAVIRARRLLAESNQIWLSEAI